MARTMRLLTATRPRMPTTSRRRSKTKRNMEMVAPVMDGLKKLQEVQQSANGGEEEEDAEDDEENGKENHKLISRSSRRARNWIRDSQK